MLSTKHLSTDHRALFTSNARTIANDLKLAYGVTDNTKLFTEHVQILCQIAILEQIADGKDVDNPYEVDLPLDVADYLPCALKVFVESVDIVSRFESTKYQILDSFREAYVFVCQLYPQLDLVEED